MQFIDLVSQQARLKDKIDERIQRVLDHGNYIMGPEVQELEDKLRFFCGAKHCVTCANGTDALVLSLMALRVGSGDAVIVPSFTFAASAEAPCLVGATPIFAEVDPDTYNIDPISLERCIKEAKARNLVPKAVIAVDLFGLPADYPAITSIVKAHGLKLIGDSAQGWGGTINGRMTGTFGDITTTSFFPAKPLGCYGDGGAIFTDDDHLAEILGSLRVHGKGTDKYDNVRIGTNSRLDTIQAAILLEKLSIYAEELETRNDVAARYTAALHHQFKTPHVPSDYRSIWAQYTLMTDDSATRGEIMSKIRQEAGIPSTVYYPRPLHIQSAYDMYPRDPEGLETTEDLAQRVFSVPMHPYLSEIEQKKVIDALCL